MKKTGRDINGELRLHNNMLKNLNEDVDDVNRQMLRVDTKLKKLLNNTNAWYLWIFIVIEVIVLVVLIIAL